MIGLTSERLRALRGIGLRVGFGLVVFVVAFTIWFPYQRIKELVTALASQQDLDVQIDSAGPILGVGLAFQDIVVQNRPIDGTRPMRLRIDDARVSVSVLARLLGEEAYNLSARAMGGDIDVGWEAGKTKSRLAVKSAGVAMADLPGVKETINLPLGGTLGLEVDLSMPGNKVNATEGFIHWACAACAVGDGKAKLKVTGNPMLSEGLSLPRVRLGDFTGRVTFEKGVGKLQAVQAKSLDGELYIEGEVRLADPLPLSLVDLYIRFKLSDALLKSSDKLGVILQLVESMGKRPDGFFGMRLQGSLGRLGTPQWMKTSPFASAGAAPPPRPMAAGRAVPARIASAVAAPSPTGPDQLVDPAKDPNANVPRYPTVPSEPAPPPPPVPGNIVPPPPPPAPPPAAEEAKPVGEPGDSG